MKDLVKLKKNKAKRKIVLESILVFFIAVSPFLYKLYDYVPESSTNTLKILGLTIGANGFADVSTFIWFMMGKLVPLYLLIFWFLTAKNWWYHIILIPIAMYAFQIFEVLYSHDDDIDTENLLWLLPICMIVIPFVYFIRIKLYDKHVHGIDLEAIDAELQELKKKTELSNIEQKNDISAQTKELRKQSLSEELNQKLSTGNIENILKHFQHKVQDWLHI